MNRTVNYDLCQYEADDKTSYLVNYNNDMLKIDTAIKSADDAADAAQAKADSADGKADINAQSISTLNTQINGAQGLAADVSALEGSVNTINSLIGNGEPTTSDKTLIGAINELDSNNGDLSNLTTTAKNNLVSAINEINAQTSAVKLVKFNEGITINADGVKTWAQLLTEAISAYSAVVSASTSTHKFALRNINIGGTVLASSANGVNDGGNAVGGSIFSSVNTISGGCSTYCARCVADGSTTAYLTSVIGSDGTASIINNSSTVPTSDKTVIISYDEYV